MKDDDPEATGRTATAARDHTLRPTRRLSLRVVAGPVVGLDAVLGRTTVRIGRSRVNDIVIDDPKVSGTHAEIHVSDGGELELIDLASSNGTYVGDRRIKHVWLRAGDRVWLGQDTCIEVLGTQAMDVTVSGSSRFGELVGYSSRMREAFAELEALARADPPLDVLLIGETGTGKNLAAAAIHAASARKDGPFIALNCGGLTSTLQGAELFGYVKGAYTGADRDRRGAFEAASGGTLFLDEIAELTLEMQVKLLHVLDHRTARRGVKRIGDYEERSVDVRIIAATNKPLHKLVSEGTFREDLYFRIFKVTVELPPLRMRRDDIPQLAAYFLARSNSAFELTREAVEAVQAHPWPGNVRELQGAMDYAAFRAATEKTRFIAPAHLGLRSHGTARANVLEDIFRTSPDYKTAHLRFDALYLPWLLRLHGGNRTQAAAAVHVSRKHLRERLERAGITQAEHDPELDGEPDE